MQMKFYSPLTAEFFPNDTEDLGDDYSEYEGIPYTGKELAGYRDVIRDAIYEDVKDFYGDLMRYYREDAFLHLFFLSSPHLHLNSEFYIILL